MTKEAFDNQKWYKGIKIKYEGGEYFVWRIDFGLNRVQISYKSRLEASLIWLLYTEFTIVQEEPTALDLISFEATLPQIKRLKELVKAQKELIALYDEENLSDPAWLKESELREQIKTLES